ncbi:phosphatase PAP2 family protein [Variovorax sp. RB3P1]|uniref:phosphatase PAP2 family protein n=1 Tax=Variovorax sp. RB3P1 TaxID=3443732 RepID=UPI003F4588A5
MPLSHDAGLSLAILWMGDSGLVCLVAAAMAVLLVLSPSTRRLALRWTLTFAVATGVVFSTKLGLLGWGHGIDALHFRGPSGHAALSSMTWPVAAWLITARARRWVRWAALVSSMALAFAIACILVAGDYHFPLEVLAGDLLGGLAAFGFIRAAQDTAPPRSHTAFAAGLAVALLVFTQHGQHVPVVNRLRSSVTRLLLDPAVPDLGRARAPSGA